MGLMDWISRLMGRTSAGPGKQVPDPESMISSPPAPVAETTASHEDDINQTLRFLRMDIERAVAGGFMPPNEILPTFVEVHGEDLDPAILTVEGQRMLAEVLAAHRLAQANWPEVTDCDRLDAAFAALEANGVISRQDFTCCGTCGASEIHGEIDAARREGRPAHGYAFYHQQDTESAADGGGLYLNYGADEPGDEAAVAVGHEIVAALKAKGLSPEWNGRIERRIHVPMDWKRRMPGTTIHGSGNA